MFSKVSCAVDPVPVNVQSQSGLYPDFTVFGDVFDRFSLVLHDIFVEPVNAVMIVSLAGKTPQVQAASSFESGLATSVLL